MSGVDPHRPAIDEVTFPCPDCAPGGQGVMRRVEPVIDAWFDSGSMPTAQWGYPGAPGSDGSFVYPADFICEAIDQTRGWFYSLLAVNTLVRGTTPYRTCSASVTSSTPTAARCRRAWATSSTRGRY